MKIKMKNSINQKLLSYAALGAAFLLTSGEEAQAQCGVVDPLNPVLNVDIDGDGTVDVTFQNVSQFNAYSGYVSSVLVNTN